MEEVIAFVIQIVLEVGLQLFGSVTWWLFWEDGYAPLAALDDNHDGRLEGAELKGIAIWFDRNGNGVHAFRPDLRDGAALRLFDQHGIEPVRAADEKRPRPHRVNDA